ncbi:hypothetical protein [Photobacterium damselae]|uniref:hypothetical protein n=1 Tax=Photobacterium damselae TaxID=38293 RepID=UPI0011C02F35|nr:hypothetical protein [Photobacterium damselae]
MNILEKIKIIIELYKSFYKPILITSMIAGSIYLNGFLSSYGVPFPLDIAVLPSTLLIIGTLSLLIVIITSIYVILMIFMNSDPLNTGYHLIINTSKYGVISFRSRNYIPFIFITYLLPFSLLFATIYRDLIPTESTYILLIVIFLWSFFCSCFISRNKIRSKKSRNIFIGLFTLHLFIFQIISFTSLMIFLLIIIPRAGDINDLKLSYILFFYIFITVIFIIPIFSKNKLKQLNNSDNDNLDPDFIAKNIQTSPVLAIIFFMILFSLLPQTSSYVAEIPLRLMNIGGGIKFIATDEIKKCDTWPSFIISKRDKSSCITKTGTLILQLGDKTYALFKDGKDDKVVSLNLSKSSIVTDIPKNSIRL